MKLKELIKTALFVDNMIVVATIPCILQILFMLMTELILILHGLLFSLLIFAEGKVGFNAQLSPVLDFS